MARGLPSPGAASGRDRFLYLLHPPRPSFMIDASPAEVALLKRHYRYLSGLMRDGRLLLAGPCLDEGGFGVVLIQAAGEREAIELAEGDPAVREGLFRVELHPFRVSLWASRPRSDS